MAKANLNQEKQARPICQYDSTSISDIKLLGLKHFDSLQAVKERDGRSTTKCKECSLSFEDMSELKMHILFFIQAVYL